MTEKEYKQRNRAGSLAGRKIKRQTRYEVIFKGAVVMTRKNYKQWNDYTTFVWIREWLIENLPNEPFEVYKIVKAQFPPAGEEDVPVKRQRRSKAHVIKMDRPTASYSNHSPFRIAK